MADGSVFVLATLTPKEGKLEEVATGMKELAAEVEKNEPGCLLYQVFTNSADGTIIVIEKYKDLAAVQAHKDAPYYADALKQGGDTLAAPPKINVLSHAAGFARH